MEEVCVCRDVEVLAVLNELCAWLVPLVFAVVGGAVWVPSLHNWHGKNANHSHFENYPKHRIA